MGRSSRTFRFLFVGLNVLILGCGCLTAPTLCKAQGTALDLSGKATDPLKLAPGKVVVLIFVRADCPVSNRYAPTLQKVSAEYAKKAEFWLVYPSKSESAEIVRKHEREYGYKLTVVRDPEHVLVKKSQVQITPEVAVFDRDRRLVYHGRIDNLYADIGRARRAATTHELEDAIRAAYDGKAPVVTATQSVGCYISDLE